ncbi:MAG: iron ABC transporter permease, partial [Aggregatilineales bacterium]
MFSFSPKRYLKEFRQIAQDPVLAIGLAVVTLFLFIAIILPLLSMLGEGISGVGIEKFKHFLLGDLGAVYQNVIKNTIVMGLLVATFGTALGFLFAFVQVKLDVPFKRLMHIIALVPIISPPFAVGAAVILLFGRNGMISKDIFGVRYDIFGLDGLTFVLSLSYFTI